MVDAFSLKADMVDEVVMTLEVVKHGEGMGKEAGELSGLLSDVAQTRAQTDNMLDALVEFPNSLLEVTEEGVGALEVVF